MRPTTKAIALACALLAACGAADETETESKTEELEEPYDPEPDVTAHLLTSACDTSYVALEGSKYVSHPIASFSVPVESVRSAWACKAEPRETAGVDECIGVLPFITETGAVAVPCENEAGDRYREARLVVEY